MRAGEAMIIVLSALLSCPGCATQLDMARLDEASQAKVRDQPHTIILYSGVREGARRFPDYSGIDKRILSSGHGDRGDSREPE